jgi:hypothetical protein
MMVFSHKAKTSEGSKTDKILAIAENVCFLPPVHNHSGMSLIKILMPLIELKLKR